MHHSSKVEPSTSGSSQNPQFCSQPSPSTNPNTCYRPSLSNIEPPSNEVETPIGVDNIQLDEGDQNSGGKKIVIEQSIMTFFMITMFHSSSLATPSVVAM